MPNFTPFSLDHLPQTLMAFDFGLKRIGVAFGQTITQTASPITTLPAKEGIPVWEDIIKLINQWRPQALVVGIPLLMDGSEQHLTYCARKFANRLQHNSQLPVFHLDERLTTRAARLELSQLSNHKKVNHLKVDSLAACLIAEGWLASPCFTKL